MVPVGYMAKRVPKRSDRLQAPHVVAVFSVSNCNGENFTDYIPYWKDNGYGLFDGERWTPWSPEPSFRTDVPAPSGKQLAGFDVVSFTASTSPECSGLSCSSLAAELRTNANCLSDSFDEAETNVSRGGLTNPSRGHIEYSQFIP
jgi:hypothetical protein